jgi:ubiquinone/menaquinone biosynthesis C-methylase UbiE
MISRYIFKISKLLGLVKTYKSETAKVRHMVLPFCKGYGCDIGFGGDKIKKDAVGIDLPSPYASTGSDKIDIACDVMKEPIPVADNSFDYVYSSHLIEDFEDTLKGLNEFIRVVKPGGNLILVFPDQQRYEQICKKTGQPLNLYHKHADMGMELMKSVLTRANIKYYDLLLESNCEIDYNVVMVMKIFK